MAAQKGTKSLAQLGDSFKQQFDDFMGELRTQKAEELARRKEAEKLKAQTTMRKLTSRLKQRQRALKSLAGHRDVLPEWKNPSKTGTQFHLKALTQGGRKFLTTREMRQIHQLPRSIEPAPQGKKPFLLTHNHPVDIHAPAKELLSDFGKNHIEYGLDQLQQRAQKIKEEEDRYQQYKRHILENKQTKVFKSTLKVKSEYFTQPILDTINVQSRWQPDKPTIHGLPFRRTARTASQFSYAPRRIE